MNHDPEPVAEASAIVEVVVPDVPPPPPTSYEESWDEYSRIWDKHPYFGQFLYLGDEWGDDRWVAYNVTTFVTPYVTASDTVLELGPGGGRYTAQVLPSVAGLIGVDVSQEMIRRLTHRFTDQPHATFIKGDGRTLAGVEDASVDHVFSFNCFVQLELEDFFGYLLEIARVLRPGGRASLQYAEFSGLEGWKHFESHREAWSHDPSVRGRFHPLTLQTVDLLAERAGLICDRNQSVARDAIVVLRKPEAGGMSAPPETSRETRRDFRWIDRYLDQLAEDVYHEVPTPHHTAAANETVERMVEGLGITSALELGCGAAPMLDRLAEMGIETRGVTLGAEPCDHPVLHEDMHFSGIPNASADLIVARHIVEHSPMPLLLLMEMHRLSARYALVVVPCDDLVWVEWHNHYSVFGKPMWNKLFTRAGFRVIAEEDGPLEPDSTEWRFLLEKT